ncbi:beta-phosphoglucomutase [Haloplasma contractile]|uniref:Beta-phosphoglucomutase n=1 Tax=Haloplasma contractile SSD-17B TaxID=1033810 RepID=F7Q1J0_9MOLU|nr:beta-phosphoglucomutase [Haloplasma contractile]ERJ12919.1 putative phosphatase-phosphohexomutase ral function prediction only protein [Haloplasma contractile SSD-17B]
MIKAIIFDLDGVITDTAEYHYLAWKALATEVGIDFDETFNENLKGVSRMESLELILKHGNRQDDFTKQEKVTLATKKNEQYKTLIKRITPGHYLPGIKELLMEIKEAGYKIGVASASFNAPTIIDRLAANNYIDYIVDPGSVDHGKPAPDLFLNVADHFSVRAESCIGIEDAKAGIEAINRAGMFSVGVGTGTAIKEADLIVQSTSELSLERLLLAAGS